MCCNYPGIKLEPAIRDKTKFNICHHMFTSSTQLQKRSFHVVETTRRSAKCRKMKNARAKRAKLFFFVVKYANLWRRGCFKLPFREFKEWRQQRQQQRHKPMIWFVEGGNIIVLHVRHAFWCNVLMKSAKPRSEIFHIWGSDDSKSSTLCVYMKSIRAKQAKVLHFVYLVQRDQNGR